MREAGVNGTSVDDVLNESKTGKSQFYHYFGSKNLMVRELLRFELESFCHFHPNRLEKIIDLDSLEVWLYEFAEAFDEGELRNGSPIGNIACELSLSQSELLEICREIFVQWQKDLSEVLERLVDDNKISQNIEPNEAACLLVGLLEGSLLLAKTAADADGIRQAVRQLIRLVYTSSGRLEGAKKAPRRSPGFCP